MPPEGKGLARALSQILFQSAWGQDLMCRSANMRRWNVHTLIISQVFSFNKRDIERFKYTEGGTAILRADLSYPACLESNHTSLVWL